MGRDEDNKPQPEFEERNRFLDPFLAEMKRRENLGLIREWAEAAASGRVLKTDLFEEAGGPDAFLPDLAAASELAVGLDMAAGVVFRAAQRHRGSACLMVVADARALPFADATFDLVTSPSTLDHFADPADLGRSLEGLRRLIRRDGCLVITLDNRQNLFDPLLRLAARLHLAPFFLGRSYTVVQLRHELEAAGWRVVETTAILHNPRLVATGLVAVTRLLRWGVLTRAVQRLLEKAQRLRGTRWRYWTGSFVAALAVPETPSSGGEARRPAPLPGSAREPRP